MNLLGPRIRIRPVRREDLPFLQVLWNDGSVMRYQGYPEGMHATAADMERWWVALQTARPDHQGLASLPSPHTIIETIDGTPLGELTYSLDAKERARFDLKLAPRFWKQGYGGEAMRIFLRELFVTTKVKTVIMEPSPDNAPARRLLERNGFHPTPTENHPNRWECERHAFASRAADAA